MKHVVSLITSDDAVRGDLQIDIRTLMCAEDFRSPKPLNLHRRGLVEIEGSKPERCLHTLRAQPCGETC